MITSALLALALAPPFWPSLALLHHHHYSALKSHRHTPPSGTSHRRQSRSIRFSTPSNLPSRVAVIGASGNVGKLVVSRLLEDGYAVRGIVRSEESVPRLTEYVAQTASPPPDVAVADIASASNADALRIALRDATVVVACTGTTAFPTRAWAGGDVSVDQVLRVVFSTWRAHGFDVRRTLDHLSARGMNTPDVVDGDGLERLADAFGDNLAHVVLVSSLGVTRRDTFPFKVLNAAGVLDAKARGEAAIVAAAHRVGAAWTILRPGQLFGPPFDNDTYLGTIFRLDKPANTRAIDISKGDTVAGDTLRSALADVVVCSIQCPAAQNTDFTVLSVRGVAPSKEDLDSQIRAALSAP